MCMETKALFLKAVLICITCKERLPNLYALVGAIKNYDFSYFFMFSITMLVTIPEVASSFVLLVFSFTFIETLSNKTVLNIFDNSSAICGKLFPFHHIHKKNVYRGEGSSASQTSFFF